MVAKGKKISIIGVGFVGATIAYTITIDGMASEIVLVDANRNKAEGEAMDIIQGTPFTPNVNIYAGDYADTANSDIIIVTAGINRKPGQTRLELAQTNVDIIKTIVPEVVKHSPGAVYVIVSNPVDIITHAWIKLSGLPEKQVIGSGTMLDTARLRNAVAQHVNLPSQNVHAYVLGEHGDSSVIPWSLTSIAGMPMPAYCESVCAAHNRCGKIELNDIIQDVRTAGAKVIAKKGATYYAVSLSVRRLCESIFRDSNSIHTVSTMLHGEYGINDLCLSLPFVVGAGGIKRSFAAQLTPGENELLQKSAASIAGVINSINI